MDVRVGSLRVLISLSGGDVNQRHAGFILDGDQGDELIHMGWHKWLLKWTEERYRNDIGPFLSLDCPYFNELEAEELSSFIRSLWRRYQRSMPYSIVTNGVGEFFNLSGEIAVEQAGVGLTCATFLMSVFGVQGYSLLDESDWQRRPGDKAWHQHILNELRKSGVEEEHVAAQERYVGEAYRYRPEEVVGCASGYSGVPHPFCAAVAEGERVLGEMRQAGVMPA